MNPKKTWQPYEELERKWAEFNHLDPAGMVACSSGTAALHLALEALGLPPGSEVLVPDYTMIACPRAVTLAGLTPVFVDCDDRLTMTTGDPRGGLASVDWSRITAVMLVHVYGRTQTNRKRVVETAKDIRKWAVVEDLAEAHGVCPHPATDAACWSFYRNKIVFGEEGGAVWFRDRDRAKVARELRSLGFTDAHDFRHRPRGHNYRLANCLAEKVLTSIEILPWTLRARRTAEGWYEDTCPVGWRMPPRDAPWVYDLRVPGLTRPRQREIVRALNAVGVEARMGFFPCSMQDEYQGFNVVSREVPPRSYVAAMEVFYLPLSPGMVTRESVGMAFDVIKKVLREKPFPAV